MWHYGITHRRCEDNLILSPIIYTTLVWSTPLGLPERCGKHAPTFNKWQEEEKKKKKKKTLHMLTHGALRGCGLTSWVVCINDKFCDIRKRNVTIRSEIWTMNICSLGFRDIREYVTLWRLILWSLGCNSNTLGVHVHMSSMYFY